ncbi:MAG: PLP-dependent lyase/thiolase [Rhodobacterales bacterium]|nr:MAG: PLP-dependent lyase/thiolase [Rhodobacterales bacterium]
MERMNNPYRGAGLPDGAGLAHVPVPSVTLPPAGILAPLNPEAGETPLVTVEGVGSAGTVWVKDERGRMGLGSFKALGAAYVIACHARDGKAEGRTYVTASAGNHGLSVAAGAAAFGAQAVVYLSAAVPEGFAARLRATGAQVVRVEGSYEDSMDAAGKAAVDKGWTLLSDSSWDGYFDLPHRLMEGYLTLAAEAVAQCPDVPTHIFLQAGVGGMAASAAALFRKAWGDAPCIIVVEPEAAPALFESVRAGRCVETSGPVSEMGRLDCKVPSLIALKGLARDADMFVTLSEAEARDALPVLAGKGLATTASGGAGLAAMLCMTELSGDARGLAIVSEEAEA